MHTTLSKKDFSRYLPFLLLVMTVFRVLAGLRIPYMILANQRYDDRLLFENAYDLLSGVWLGSYDSYTLAKGIGYPLFLVLAKKLCLPYSVLLSLLQAAGAWLFVRAVSVRWQNPYGQAILYLLLLFSPISLTLLVTQRLYRMAIVPGMVLVVFSSMIGLTLRKELPLKKQLPWAFLTGLTLAFFWQIREDSVWILPFIAVMTVWNVGYVILVLHKKLNTKALLLHCLTMLLPLLLLFGANTGVSVVNRIHYGVFLNNDRTEGNFAELMSLLYHLDSNTRTNPDIWISRDTIVRAEAASPTLQQIQPLLDSYTEDWATRDGEIPGDHFSWVLRDAVQDSGIAPNAVSAQTFYGNVLSELRAAVASGELTEKTDGALYFSSQSRGVLPEEIPGILSDTLQNIWKIAGYTNCALSSSAKSAGRLSDIRRMESFASCLTVYPTLSQFQAADYDSIEDESLYDFNEIYSSGMVSLLNKSNAIYQLLGQPMFLLALLALCVLTVRVIHGLFHGDTKDLELWILTCGILLSAVLLRFGCGLFTAWFSEDMQKFINSFYSCGVYILLQMFKYLAVITTATSLQPIRKQYFQNFRNSHKEKEVYLSAKGRETVRFWQGKNA